MGTRLTIKSGTQSSQVQDVLMTAQVLPPRAHQSPEGKGLESRGPGIATLATGALGGYLGPGRCTLHSGQLFLNLVYPLTSLIECHQCHDKSFGFVHFSISTSHSK